MIKAVLFDYDGVITAGVGDGSPGQRLAQNISVSVEQANEWILEVWDGLSTGELSEAAAWQRIEQAYGQQITSEQRAIWYNWDELTPLPEMVTLVGSLKAQGFPVGVVSNVIPITAQVIREHGGYDVFDFVVLSCEVGARKPSPVIFDAALKNIPGIVAEEVIFLDDREPLTTAAKALGFQTIHVTNHAEAIKQVHELISQ